MAERHAAHHGLRECHAESAGLTDHADGLPGRLRDGCDVHERHAHVQRRVDHADAVWPNDAHAGFARDGSQAVLLVDAVLLAGLRIARGEDDHATDAGAGAIQYDFLHRFARGGDHGAIRDLGQRGDIGIAAMLADLFVACVHWIVAAAIMLQVVQHAFAERARPG